MELWIRSQDGLRLTTVCDLRIVYLEEEKIWAIDCCDYVGFYQTKERALEVLDDIQKFIINEFEGNHLDYEHADLFLKSKIIELMVRVYVMPKE